MEGRGEVVVVGGMNVDTLARISAETVPGSSNPGRTSTAHGGVGRNVAENLARLGSPVRLIGVVGEDAQGADLLAALRLLDVDCSGVRRSADCSTGTYTAVLDHDGGLVIGVADMAATESLRPEHIADSALRGASWLVLDGNLRTDTIARCLALADQHDVPVVLDPVGVTKAARLGRLPGLHTFTPNHDELLAWAGTEDVEEARARAHAQGIEVVWLREGAEGSTLHTGDGTVTTLRLPPAPVVDVTGAGDAMLAAYVHRLRAGDPVVQAGWFATAAAWLTVGSPTTVRHDLTEDLVRATLEDFR
ncbi:MAG TPA: carbohydrate kinase family protein [Marmoricola sp.]|nr:carbohydrate kinase family protein [Marmoricola sp.]